MFCKYCGTKLEEGAQFCPNCGEASQTYKKQTDASTEKSISSISNEKKGKIKLTALTVIVFIVVIIGIIFYSSNQNRPVKQIEKAFQNQDINAAITMFDEIEEYDDIVFVKELAKQYTETIFSDFVNNTDKNTKEDYEDIINPLIEICNNILTDDADLVNQIALVEQIYADRTSFKTAKNYGDSGQLLLAMELIDTISQSDEECYKQAQKALAEYMQKYVSETLENVEQLLGKDDYSGAESTLEAALEVCENNLELSNKLTEVQVKKNEAYLQECLGQISDNIEKGNYTSALDIINNATNEIANNIQIMEYKKIAMEKYKELCMDEVQNLCNAGSYEQAILILRDMQAYLPNDTEIDRLIEKYQGFLPIALTSLKVHANHGAFDMGSVVYDIFGNSYPNSIFFESYGEDISGDSFSANITYMINKKYNRLSGTMAYGDVMERYRSGVSHFEIYSDGVLVYTSPKIDEDTQPINFEANLGNSCQKIMIKVVADNIFDAMCVLGNAQLYNRD